MKLLHESSLLLLSKPGMLSIVFLKKCLLILGQVKIAVRRIHLSHSLCGLRHRQRGAARFMETRSISCEQTSAVEAAHHFFPGFRSNRDYHWDVITQKESLVSQFAGHEIYGLSCIMCVSHRKMLLLLHVDTRRPCVLGCAT